MFEKFKKNMPTCIMAVGLILFCIFTFASRFTGQGYKALAMSEYMLETAFVVLTQCIASSVAFRILLKKAKSADRGFGQK